MCPTRALGMLAVLACLVLSGCGGSEDEPTTTVTTAPDTELTIAVDPGDGTAQEWRLTCQPTGGDHPQPEPACEALQTVETAVFEPVPPDQSCTMIYGGPETATVTGTWDGTSIESTFSRDNGCEIHRWDQLSAVLVIGGDSTGQAQEMP